MDEAPGGFRNPVHQEVLADPFVLKHNGRYWAYGTPAEGPLPVLSSTDLVTWRRVGTAIGPPPPGTCYWAPEVAYDNGTFFLYYSVGGEEGEGHQLRVATATEPTGPFADRGAVLDPADPFTIDAHPFRDDDGTWYLFYGRDFTEGERVGTGIVVDRLADMLTLAGERATVVRPHAEWHVYERQRRWYGRVWDWYTVEGPFVRKHDGRYWCFFSGGAWRAGNYGVTCAVADHPMGPYTPRSAADGADILRTVPGEVIGPGHASIAVAPDNVTEYLVYHAWDPALSGRFMCLDRLLWDDGGPASPGPTTVLQPRPPEPAVRLLFDGPPHPLTRPEWDAVGDWKAGGGEVVHHDGSRPGSVATFVATPLGDVLIEANVALRRAQSAGPAYGLVLGNEAGGRVAVEIVPGDGVVARRSWDAAGVSERAVIAPLPRGFAPAAFHQLQLRRRAGRLEVSLDGSHLGAVPGGDGRLGLWADGAAVTFAGVAVTTLAAPC